MIYAGYNAATTKIITLVLLLLRVAAPAHALQASWYSMASLRAEGTFKYSAGITASGARFNENALTCACRLYPIGTWLKITNMANGRAVIVRVNDRIGRRFAKSRIDLAKAAFARIALLSKGIINITAEVVK